MRERDRFRVETRACSPVGQLLVNERWSHYQTHPPAVFQQLDRDRKIWYADFAAKPSIHAFLAHLMFSSAKRKERQEGTMTVDTQGEIEQADRPLTRADVERLLEEAGSSDRLNLQGKNLRGADLSSLDLHGADLSRADLRDADLTHANLEEVNFHQANLTNAKLADAHLWGAYLKETQPEAYNLRLRIGPSGLGKTSSIRTFLEDQTLQEGEVEYILEPKDYVTMLKISILEEPLTLHNVTLILSALSVLATKYWLIGKGRFADLIEYTQTQTPRFNEEAAVLITNITYRSPLNIEWRVDVSAPSVAEALITTIDGIAQVRKRLEKAELENQARAQEVRHAEQQAESAQQVALLEQEHQRLAIEQQRLELLEKRLEVQKKGIEYAFEIAGRVVDTLHPGADPAARAMEIQALLPNLLQLQNGRGLELALPSQPPNAEPSSRAQT